MQAAATTSSTVIARTAFSRMNRSARARSGSLTARISVDRRVTTPRHKHRRKQAEGKSLVPVRIIPDVGHQRSTAHSIEIAWPNGVALRILVGCDSKTLREVFDLLSSAMKGEIVPC